MVCIVLEVADWPVSIWWQIIAPICVYWPFRVWCIQKCVTYPKVQLYLLDSFARIMERLQFTDIVVPVCLTQLQWKISCLLAHWPGTFSQQPITFRPSMMVSVCSKCWFGCIKGFTRNPLLGWETDIPRFGVKFRHDFVRARFRDRFESCRGLWARWKLVKRTLPSMVRFVIDAQCSGTPTCVIV